MTEHDITNKAIEILTQTSESRLRYASSVQFLKDQMRRSEDESYRLGVIGVTSSGKSTMINSFLGEDLLPSGTRPSSNQLVRCRYSRQKGIIISFENGDVKRLPLSPKVLAKYGDENTNVHNRERVKDIALMTPLYALPKEMVLVDSPGLDAFGYEGHEQLTMNSLLPTVDFCIFVTTCKTNSDAKTLAVLNAIAEKDKYVIIVQNMIDSIKESPDKKKSAKEVANEHKRRVERIVEASNIRDKEKVKIVQISAIQALRGRSLGDKTLLEKSNYKKLTDAICSVFEQIKPHIENQRIDILKREIERIKREAKEDARGATVPIEKFPFEDTSAEMDKRISECEKILADSLSVVKNMYDAMGKRTAFYDGTLKKIKGSCQECIHSITRVQKEMYEYACSLCDKLNISSRDLFETSTFPPQQTLTLQHDIRTKKILVKQSGIRGRVKRLFGSWFNEYDWGYDERTITEEVVNHTRTKQNVLRYIKQNYSFYEKEIKRWLDSVDKQQQKLDAEINKRREEYASRREKALAKNVYREIARQLETLSSEIPNYKSAAKTSVRHSCSDIHFDAIHNVTISRAVWNIYKIAERIKMRIHIFTYRCLLPRWDVCENIVIGWDKQCEAAFVKHAFGYVVSDDNIKVNTPTSVSQNVTILNYMECLHTREHRRKASSNVFVLVNATQIGEAKAQMHRANFGKFVSPRDRLFFVIQDFMEIINGNSVQESLRSMNTLGKDLSLNKEATILLEHENPIFNLCAIEIQNSKFVTHSDETRIIDTIQKRFPYLRNSKYDNIIALIVRTLKRE